MKCRALITYTTYGYSARLPSAQTALGFNGESVDAATGLYPLGKGYRIYSPNLMRFLSPDELSPFAEGGLNMYMYCNGDPVGKVDPSGRVSVFIRPLNSLYKGIKNRFFGRIPKSQRPPQTPDAQPFTHARPAESNARTQQTVDPFMQQIARADRAQLNRSNQMDLNDFWSTDLSTVPSEIFESRLDRFNARKARIKQLTQEYDLEPLNLPSPTSPAQNLTSNLALPIRRA